MKYLILTLLLVSFHFASSQLSGEFWWQKPPANPEPPKPAPQPVKVDERYQPATEPHGPSQQRCKCVPYFQCKDGEIITDGEGIIDIRVGPGKNDTRRVGGNCENILDVCCDKPNQSTTTTQAPYPPTTQPHRPNQQTCKCVPYYQCKDGQIITDGEGIIDIRVQPNKNDTRKGGGNCENVLDVCCGGPDQPITPTQAPYPPTPDPHPPPYTNAQCGVTLDTGNEFDIDIRIHLNKSIHGFEGVAPFAAYPWMAAVLVRGKRKRKKRVYKCGGSLIHPQVILTAAHCVDAVRAKQLRVRLGEWDTQSERDHEVYLHKDYKVADIILHEQYVVGTRRLFDDIALLFLEKEALLDHHINTVCLPQPGQTFVNQRCYATGWGRDNFGEKGVWQAILKEVDLPIVEHHSCQNQFKAEPRLGCRFCLHDTFLCAGGEVGKDTCQGDGGSPLVCFSDGVAVQSGIVAWGIGCGNALPAAYVDVSRYVHWIDHTVSTYLSDTSTFNYQWQQPYSYEGSYSYDECKNNLFNGAYNQFPPNHRCDRLRG